MKIKFSKIDIKKKDLNIVNKIIRSGWLTHGKYSEEFENEIKKFTKAKYCTLVSSCTAGLHLSCISAGFKKGDEVIVPAITHTATAHAIEYTGAKAVIVDIKDYSGNIDYEEIKKKINKRTKGIIIVHMSGVPCQIDKILPLCRKFKIKLIEDCAHSLGTKFNQKHVGNFGLSGVFSFYPTKQITTGEGGAIITNDEKFFKKIKRLKAFGIDKDIHNRKKPGDYDVLDLGYNYRLTDFQASLGLSQIKKYKLNLIKRKLIAKKYIKNLSKTNKINYTPFSENNSYFVFQIFCKKRNLVLNEFKKLDIGFSIHYPNPLYKMSYYKKKYNLNKKKFVNSKLYSNENVSLPVYPQLKDNEINYITDNLIRILK